MFINFSLVIIKEYNMVVYYLIKHVKSSTLIASQVFFVFK